MKLSSNLLTIGHTWDGRPVSEAEAAKVTLRREGGMLVVEVQAPFHGDPPPPGPPGSTAGLWNYEVIELFVAEANPGSRPLRYTEIELSPHGHFLVLKLEGIRNVVTSGLSLDFEAGPIGERWNGCARLSLEHLPKGPHRGNAFAVHGPEPHRRHLVHSPLTENLQGSSPDFHRPEAFVPLDF